MSGIRFTKLNSTYCIRRKVIHLTPGTLLVAYRKVRHQGATTSTRPRMLLCNVQSYR